MKVWEGKPVIGFLFTWGLLRSQLQRQNKAKYFSDPLHTYPPPPHQYWHLVVATETHEVGKRAVRVLLEYCLFTRCAFVQYFEVNIDLLFCVLQVRLAGAFKVSVTWLSCGLFRTTLITIPTGWESGLNPKHLPTPKVSTTKCTTVLKPGSNEKSTIVISPPLTSALKQFVSTAAWGLRTELRLASLSFPETMQTLAQP